MAQERILRPMSIPATLWNAEKETLFIPTHLAQAYTDLVDSRGLRHLAGTRDRNDSPVGGLTQEATDAHLAQAFDGSVARALLAVLDPKAEADSTSNTFIRVTAGNSVSITDAPCGAGAATLAFLCVLAELREKSVLPRLPLRVMIVGGEISEPAAEYAKHLLEAVRPVLLSQAISVEHEIISWDVTSPMSTTDLIKCALLNNEDSASKLLVVANFNGFLESNGKRKEALPQLKELFRYASGDNSFAVWIEPKMNKALSRGGLFDSISDFFSTFWKRHVSKDANEIEGQTVFTSEALFERPLSRPDKGKVRLAVMPINLQRADR